MTNRIRNLSFSLAIVIAMATMSGCLDSGADTVANDVDATVPAQNAAPSISGTPPTIAVVGQTYVFVPQANDPNGDSLTFSIESLPGWASFDPATGELAGTPSAGQEGTYAGIVITVSDGQYSSSTSTFSIDVTQSALGAASLSWTPPTSNSDGSSLLNLAGYKIYYGLAADRLTNVISVNSPGVTRFVVQNLAPNTYYFVATAVNSDGIESDFSNIVTKTVSAP